MRAASVLVRLVEGRPRLVLFAIAWVTALLLQPGDLGSVDAARRLQVARWLWTDEPQVLPKDTASFGAPGRDGEYQAWYGIGQSLVFLPADMLARATLRAARIEGNAARQLGEALVAFLILPLVAAGGVLAARALLLELGFGARAAFCGALSLLWCTTFLHYAQIGQENSLEFLLLAGGLSALLAWVRTGNRTSLVGGALALGFLMLVRLPHAVTIAAVSAFVAAEVHRLSPDQFRRRAVQYATTAVPIFAAFVLADRTYQWFRFGSVTTTYVDVCYEWRRQVDPALPADFPFSTPFLEGFLGPIATIHKSIFLYDPLLAASVLLFPRSTRGFAGARRFALLCGFLIAFNVLFFSTYFSWHGGSSWANRFTTVPVDLFAMLAVPMLLQFGAGLPKLVRRAVPVLVAAALAIQLSSVVFWYNLEIAQSGDAAAPAHVVRRPANIARWVAGDPMGADDGRKVSKRLRTPNFAPFLATDAVGNGVATVLQVCWGLAALATVAASGLAFAAAARGFPLAAATRTEQPAPP